ncbi:MAG: nucleotide exchange factor GrpE [Bacteroidales bacterium]|nr:nucleotide exchange factor GrpE [Bacteroidales bacterium]
MNKENQPPVKSKETKGKAKNKTQSGKPAAARSKKTKSTHPAKEIHDLKKQIEELNDKYLRLSAEYDNYRKRTLKEKMELVKSGGEQVLINILPVVDNLDRALQSIREAHDLEAVKEGIELINNKFKEFLTQNGVKEIESQDQEFNTDIHEAVTKIPAPTPEQKGKIIDVIEKGYYLHDRIIRFAKVVIGD